MTTPVYRGYDHAALDAQYNLRALVPEHPEHFRRWAEASADADFVDGMVTMLVNRRPEDLEGVAVHLYRASKSMTNRVFVDADGELYIVSYSQGIVYRMSGGRTAPAVPANPRISRE